MTHEGLKSIEYHMVTRKAIEFPYVQSRGIHFRIFKIILNDSHVIGMHDVHWLGINRNQHQAVSKSRIHHGKFILNHFHLAF